MAPSKKQEPLSDDEKLRNRNHSASVTQPDSLYSPAQALLDQIRTESLSDKTFAVLIGIKEYEQSQSHVKVKHDKGCLVVVKTFVTELIVRAEERRTLEKYVSDIEYYRLWVSQMVLEQLKFFHAKGGNRHTNGGSIKAVLSFLLILALALLTGGYFYMDALTDEVLASVRDLEPMFPSQTNETWISLSAGLRNFERVRHNRPMVLLLEGDSAETQLCLAEKFLKLMKKQPEKIKLENANYAFTEYGQLIEDMRAKLKANNNVLLLGLDLLDARLAPALHVVCDRESPLVADAVVILTSNLPLHQVYETWKSHVEEDKLVALVTRIKDRIIKVVPEPYLPC